MKFSDIVSELKRLSNTDLELLVRYLNVVIDDTDQIHISIAKSIRHKMGRMDVDNDVDDADDADDSSYRDNMSETESDYEYSSDTEMVDYSDVSDNNSPLAYRYSVLNVRPYILVWNISRGAFVRLVNMYKMLCDGLLEPYFVMGKDTWEILSGERLEHAPVYKISQFESAKCLVIQDVYGEGIGCKRFYIQKCARDSNELKIVQIDGNVGPIARVPKDAAKKTLVSNVKLTLHTYREVIEHLTVTPFCDNNSQNGIGMYGVTKTFQGISLSDTCNYTLYKFYIQDLDIIPSNIVYSKEMMHFGEDLDYSLKLLNAKIGAVKLGTYIATDLREPGTYARWLKSKNSGFGDIITSKSKIPGSMRLKEMEAVINNFLNWFPNKIITSDGGLKSQNSCGWPSIPNILVYKPLYDNMISSKNVEYINPSNKGVEKWWLTYYNEFMVDKVNINQISRLPPFGSMRSAAPPCIMPPKIPIRGGLEFGVDVFNIGPKELTPKYYFELLSGAISPGGNNENKYAGNWFCVLTYFAIEDWLKNNVGKYTKGVWILFRNLYRGKERCYGIDKLETMYPGV